MSSIIDASISSIRSLRGDMQTSLAAVKELDDMIEIYSREMDRIAESISISISGSSSSGGGSGSGSGSKKKGDASGVAALTQLKEILEYLYEMKLQVIVNLYDSTECGFKIVSSQIKGIESGQFQREIDTHLASGGTIASLLQAQVSRSNSAASGSGSSSTCTTDNGRRRSRKMNEDNKGGLNSDAALASSNMILGVDTFGVETVQPSEPVYCICNQYAYGDMIACDNEDCLIEWFHMHCVKLTKYPKNSWICPRCS